MTLAMKSTCEGCQTAVAHDGEAYICSYECTYCRRCAQAFDHVCPNCQGELARRPRRGIVSAIA